MLDTFGLTRTFQELNVNKRSLTGHFWTYYRKIYLEIIVKNTGNVYMKKCFVLSIPAWKVTQDLTHSFIRRLEMFAIFTKVSWLGYVIYFSAGTVYISWGINNIAKWALSVNRSDRNMQSGPINGGMDGDYNGVDLVEISEIFMTQDDFLPMNWYRLQGRSRSFYSRQCRRIELKCLCAHSSLMGSGVMKE